MKNQHRILFYESKSNEDEWNLNQDPIPNDEKEPDTNKDNKDIYSNKLTFWLVQYHIY